MAERYAAFTSPLLDSMGAGLRVPQGAALGTPATSVGLDNLSPSAADRSVEGQLLGGPAMQAISELQTPRVNPNQKYYYPATDEFYAGGRVFKRGDIAAMTDQSAPQIAPPPGGMAIPDESFANYLGTLSERRSTGELLGLGARQVGESFIGGLGSLAELAGATEVGPAVRGFAQGAFGQTQNEQLRGQMINENSSLFEKIIDASIQSGPTLAAVLTGAGAVGVGLKVAGAGATAITAGSTAGAAGVSFPMHISSFYDAAVRNNYDVTDPAVKGQILAGAIANTMLDSIVPGMAARALSRPLQEAAQAAGQQVARGAMRNALTGAGRGALTEGITEATQTFFESTLFDPTVRALWTASDWKTLAPYIAETYGENLLVAFGAGAILGGAIGGATNFRSTGQINPNNPENLTDVAAAQTAPQETPQAAPQIAPPGALGPVISNLSPEEAALAANWGANTALGPAIPSLGASEQGLADQWQAKLGPMQLTPGMRQAATAADTAKGRLLLAPSQLVQPAAPAAEPPLMLAPSQRDTAAEAAAGRLAPALLTQRQQVGETPTVPMMSPTSEVRPGALLLRSNQRVAPEVPTAPAIVATAPTKPAAPTKPKPLTKKQRTIVARLSGLTEEQQVALLTALEVDAQGLAVLINSGPDTVNAAIDAITAPSTEPPPATVAAGVVSVYRGRRTGSSGKGVGEAAYGIGEYWTSDQKVAERYKGIVPPVTLTGPDGRTVELNKRDTLTRTGITTALRQIGVEPTRDTIKAVSDYVAKGAGTLPDDVTVAIGTSEVATADLDTSTIRPQTAKAKLKIGGTTYNLNSMDDIQMLRSMGLTGTSYKEGDATNYVLFPPPPATTTPTEDAAVAASPTAPKKTTVQRGKPQPRAEAVPETPSAVTGGRDATAAANLPAVLDRVEGGTRARTALRSQEEVAAQMKAERAAPTAAQTREVTTKEGAIARAKAEATAAAPPQDLSTTMETEVADLIAEVQQAVADGDTFARDSALFELRRMSSQRATGLRDTDPEMAAAMRNQMRAAKRYIEGLPEQDRALADELFQKFKKAGVVEDVMDAADSLNDTVGGQSAVTRLNAMLDEYAENRDSLPFGFLTAFKETAIEVKRLGEEGTSAMRGNAPLLAYVNDQNEPNWQRGMLTPRGAFALADPGSVTNAVDLDGKPVTPIAPGRVQLLVKSFLDKLVRAPKVTVVRSQADLKAKFPQLYARAAAARPQGDFDSATAMGYAFGNGEVLIFTDRIVTEQQLRFVLAHETLGHFGLRGIMPGPKFDALMETLYKGDSRIQRAVDAAVAAKPSMSQAEAVEEYLSDYAAVLDTSIVARVWNAIKSFLNTLGVRTGDEMTRYLLDQARRYARTKEGSTFDAAYFRDRLHAVESLGGTGRFSTAPALRDVNTAAGLLRDSIGGLPMSIEEGWAYLKGQGVNSAVSWDEFKSKFLSLTNFRARQNPGLAALEELIDETRNISMSLKVSYNERLRDVLNRAIAGEVGGISDKQTDTVNRMLYAGQRAAVAKTRSLNDLGNVPLFTLTDGKLIPNTDEVKRLRAIGHRKLEEMRNGFDYDVTFDEAGQTITKKERFAGVKGLTKDSIEWRGYTKVREAMDDIELELLRARYEGSLQERDLAFRQIAATVPEGELSADERTAMTTLAQTYGSLYTANVTQDQTGRAVLDVDYQTYANDILRTSNAALIGEQSDRFDTLRTLLTEDRVFTTKKGDVAKVRRTLPAVMEAQMADDLIAQLEAFKSRMRLGEDRFVVQNKIKQVILSELASKDADKYTKRTIATGYTPILREGRFQMRVQASIGGKIVRLQDSYREQLVYSQFDSASESMEAVQKTNALFGDNEFEVMAYDQDAGEYRLQKVKLRAVAERALDAIAAPPELNLNEFIRGLRQFDIALTPAKMEDVVVALTRQNSNARNRLERSFTPGAKMDGVMATMRHIESRASTVAKVQMRPRLAELMDRSMASTNKLWDGDAAVLETLKKTAEKLAASPTARKEEIVDAQRAYEQYAYMYNQTNPGGGKPARGNQFYNEAANTVTFLDGNRNVDESDFGSGPMVSRIRAATSMMQLGGSIATGALNLLSLVTNGVPYLSSYNSKTAFGGGFSVGSVLAEMSLAGKQVGAPGVTSRAANTAEFYDKIATDPAMQKRYGINAREAAFIAKEIRDGAMIPAQSNALVGSARGRTTSGFMQKFQDGWMWTFNVTEQASRRTLGLASYRLEFARRTAAGMSEAEADAAARAFAVKAMQYTMGEYSVLNRPPAWRSGIQSFMYMYKVFPTTSVQMFMNLSRNGKLGMVAGIVLLSGIAGLPFAEDLEDLADTLAQRLKISGWQGARYETAKFIDSILPGMSTELLKGFVNEYVPADIAGRTSLGNLLPGTDILLAGSDPARALGEIFGPAPSMLLGSAKFAADALALPFSTTTSVEDVAREAPITMLRALGDTYAYLQNGAIVDRRGYTVSDQMTTGIVVARALGFYPAAAAKQYEMIRAAKRMTDYQREVATGFRTAWIKAMMRNDRDRARDIEDAVVDWNVGAKGTSLEVRDFVRNSQRALKEARRPAIERTLRSAPDAAERDLQRMVDLMTAN